MCPVSVAKERINRNLPTLLNTSWFDLKSSASFLLRPVPPTLKQWMQKFSARMFRMTPKSSVLRYKMICIKHSSATP